MDGGNPLVAIICHSTAVVGEEVYLWAGVQDGLPRVHDSDEKRAFLSSVEVFKVNTGCSGSSVPHVEHLHWEYGPIPV